MAFGYSKATISEFLNSINGCVARKNINLLDAEGKFESAELRGALKLLFDEFEQT